MPNENTLKVVGTLSINEIVLKKLDNFVAQWKRVNQKENVIYQSNRVNHTRDRY